MDMNKEIKNLLEYLNEDNMYLGYELFPDDMDVVRKALEKQLPKRLKTSDFYRGYYCNCGGCVTYQKQNYCGKCGQRIDWSVGE